MSLAITGGACVIILNHPFVNLWAGPKLYCGRAFDLLLAVYLVQHTWNHCLACLPVLSKRIGPLAGACACDMVLNIALSVSLGWFLGMNGVLAGGILGSCVSTIYLTVYAPRYFSMSPRALYYMGEDQLRHRVLFIVSAR